MKYNADLLAKELELARLTGDRRITLENLDMQRPQSRKFRDLSTAIRLRALLTNITIRYQYADILREALNEFRPSKTSRNRSARPQGDVAPAVPTTPAS